jgi:hypothetical protein
MISLLICKEVMKYSPLFFSREQPPERIVISENQFGEKMKSQILLLGLLFLVACTPQPTPGPDTPVTSPPGDSTSTNEPVFNPFAPQGGDENLLRGNAFLSEASLVIRESFPPQISLHVQGDLPTPCNQLRVDIAAPDAQNKIEVELYSVSDPNRVCAQVLQPFEEAIDLGTFPAGHYVVWVNGEIVGEFDT